MVSQVNNDLKLDGFGKVIEALRKKHDMEGKELAELIDVSPGTLVKYEKGDLTLKLSKLMEIADAVGEQPHEVLLFGLKQLFPDEFSDNVRIGEAIESFSKNLGML